MFQSRSFRIIERGLRSPRAGFASTSLRCSNQPNSPLDLDPSLQALLKDVDISLMRAKGGASLVETGMPSKPIRELEVYSTLEDEENILEEDAFMEEDYNYGRRDSRKSPAAYFGSTRIGSVVVPLELQNSINRLIAESDKPILHQDAKRLFLDVEDGVWYTTYNKKYKSYKQRAEHSERDGIAFASVALPAQYSAVYSVFDHIKRRLGPGWKAERIIEWGAGPATGLWAAGHSLQSAEEVIDRQLSLSSIINYVGIDRREGLTSMGKRLLENTDLGKLNVSWQKSFQEKDRIERADGGDVVALSAFQLSSLPTPIAKKELVKEMWESGANMIILVDHSTPEGFESIAEAREKLLTMGQKELTDPATASWPTSIKGAHVVAPCPHDGACPLLHPGSIRLVCGFSQRLQRPDFVRKTKHSGRGHEDIGYSYVVIRRGERPAEPGTKVGRTGAVGARALEKMLADIEAAKEPKELMLDGGLREQAAVDVHEAAQGSPGNATATEAEGTYEEMQIQLRQEAFSWPRLVFPPLKRSGHVILDVCTAESKIMRITIPKSQGKQPYYDARKSNWGDIFPHEPKNKPQERYQPTRAKRPGGTTPTKGGDIGKRDMKAISLAQAKRIKEREKKTRLEKLHARSRDVRALREDDEYY